MDQRHSISYSALKALITVLLVSATLLITGCVPKVDAVDYTNPNAIVIDVRTAEEWNSGHLKGAFRIDWQNIQQGVANMRVSKDQPIFLYCQSGNRAGKAEKMLLDQGYTQVYNLGGLVAASRLTGIQTGR